MVKILSFQLEILHFLLELSKMSMHKDVSQKIFSITSNINEESKNFVTYKNLYVFQTLKIYYLLRINNESTLVLNFQNPID